MFCIGPAIDLAYAQQRPLMKDFIGVNTRSTDNITYIDKFQSIREYHEWSLDAGFDEDGIANCPQNWLSFNPSYNAAAVVNFDNFYQQLAGRISPSMKWLAPEMRGLTVYNQLVQEQKPLCVDNLPGVGAQGYLPNEEAAAFFNVNTVSRDVAREDLNTSSVFYKNYVHFNAASTFELEAKVDFTSNSWAQAINVWIDQNGNGDFTDPGEALPPVTGIPGTANTVTANFTLPSFTPVNDYFRLRIAVVSNGSAGPCAGGSEVFTYDVAFIASNTGNLTLNTYCSPSPETNFEKSAISEMTIKKDGATVYHKKLKPGPSYNFYNDGSINRLVRGITYWFGLDDVLQVATQAEISVDADINGSFAGAETISYPSAYELAIPATGPTGISVMRITHRNSSGQDVGVWEYPVAIADVNGNVGTNQSGLFASSVFSQTITPNASQAVHQVSLPVDQESAVAYWDYAKWVSIVTARYGYNDVCSDPNNPYCQLLFNSVVDGDVLGAGISGLGNLKYIEFGNEPDKWWYDSEFRNTPNAAWQMMPEQYAALLHAAYDGGGGDPAFALPPTNTSYLGAKNVDGGIKVALAGISDFRGKY
ncbi:MAG TPA: hypothetical protein ENJ20_06445, partial [Bacteroidetes bacterium]|nr:hypothetical protein [Bacteroidota bacterium]